MLLLFIAWLAQFTSPFATGSLISITGITLNSENVRTAGDVLGLRSGYREEAMIWYEDFDAVRKGKIEGSSSRRPGLSGREERNRFC